MDHLSSKPELYALLKQFFEAVKGNYTMVKPKNFYSTIIDRAFANQDKETVIAAYLDTLDYSDLGAEDFIKVYES